MFKKLCCLFLVLGCCSCGGYNVGGLFREKSPFSSRIGKTFTVEINGSLTTEITSKQKQGIYDGTGTYSETVHWKSSVGPGKLCFKVSSNEEAYGEFENIDLVVREIHPTRERARWKNFSMLAKKSEGYYPGKSWKDGEEYCPEGFSLTHRLNYSELPAGKYYVGVTYRGEENWDRQSILLKIQ